MMSTRDFLDSRSESSPKFAAAFGPKAANLLRLSQAGFDVPPFLAMSPAVFDRALGPMRKRIEAILSQLDGDNPNAIESASERIRTIVNSIVFTADLEHEIFRRADNIHNGNLLAVRSSNLDEDTCASSLAGLSDSFLAIAPENVADQIRHVWASTWSVRSLAFRHRKALPWANLVPGVIVQRFVNATASGVVFSSDPANPSHILIDAAFGLGDGVTSEMAEVDSYKVSNTGEIISSNVAEKFSYVIADASGEGVRVAPVIKDNLAPVLSATDLTEIATTVVRIETLFGAPQDIEWSIEDHKLWILQSRPIVPTTGATQSGQWPGVWESANIAESYPGRTLPLTFSFIRMAYSISFEDVLCFLLPFSRARIRRNRVSSRLLGYYRGRVYMNLISWYTVLSHLPNFEKHRPVWDRMIGVHGTIECETVRLGRLDRWTAWLMLSWVFLGTRIYTAHFARRFEKFHANAKRASLDKMNEVQLVGFFRDNQSQLRGLWHLPLLNDHCAMVWFNILEKLGGGRDTPHQSVNALLCGTGRLDSAAPIAALKQIAARLLTNKHSGRILRSSCSVALEKVREDPEFADLAVQLETYLERFGDRRIEELKLESPSLREDPALVMEMIQNAARSIRSRNTPNETTDDKRQIFDKPMHQLLISFVRRQAVFAIAAREAMRMDRARLFGLVRQIFLRIGEIWEQNGELKARDDVFWLTIDEVFDRIEGCEKLQSLKELVRLRQINLSSVSQEEMPDRFETRGLPSAHVVKYSTAANEVGSIQGIGCSTGQIIGRARQVTDPRTTDLLPTDIIVTKSTDPGWVFLMANAAGLVVENGSPLSHTAIIGRELGIPTIVGAKNATHQIPDKASATLDGENGRVSWK